MIYSESNLCNFKTISSTKLKPSLFFMNQFSSLAQIEVLNTVLERMYEMLNTKDDIPEYVRQNQITNDSENPELQELPVHVDCINSYPIIDLNALKKHPEVAWMFKA